MELVLDFWLSLTVQSERNNPALPFLPLALLPSAQHQKMYWLKAPLNRLVQQTDFLLSPKNFQNKIPVKVAPQTKKRKTCGVSSEADV